MISNHSYKDIMFIKCDDVIRDVNNCLPWVDSDIDCCLSKKLHVIFYKKSVFKKLSASAIKSQETCRTTKNLVCLE